MATKHSSLRLGQEGCMFNDIFKFKEIKAIDLMPNETKVLKNEVHPLFKALENAYNSDANKYEKWVVSFVNSCLFLNRFIVAITRSSISKMLLEDENLEFDRGELSSIEYGNFKRTFNG